MGIQERRHSKEATRSKGFVMKLKSFLIPEIDLSPISDDILHGPITPEVIQYLNERNEAKRQQSIEFLGPKWLLHPDNMKQKEAQ